MRHRRPAQCRQVDAVQRADRRPRRRRRRTIPSAPSSPMSATSPCPIRASTSSPRSPNRPRSSRRSSPSSTSPGLVRGASKGEGLGNQFLANIREVDAVVHVLRCFEDGDITHVEGKVDPVGDAETVETELMLADLESLEKRVVPHREEGQGRRQGSQGAARADDEGARAAARGQARAPRRADAEKSASPIRQLGLLTAKPVLYVCNVEEGVGRDRQHISPQAVEAMAKREGAGCVVISARSRRKSRSSRPTNAPSSSKTSASKSRASNRLIRAGYELLGLHHLLHRGPEGSARLDGDQGPRAPQARRRDPHRFREGLHPRRDHRL